MEVQNMIKKYVFRNPFPTETIVASVKSAGDKLLRFDINARR